MAFWKRLIRALPLLVLSPLFMALSFVALILVQVFTRRAKREECPLERGHGRLKACATVVIPNWNGKELLA